MNTLTLRVDRLLEAHRELRHTVYRTVKPLSIWEHDADPSEPVVIRKAKALKLLLGESPAIIMEDELVVGLRTLYSELPEGENLLNGVYMLPVTPATMHSKRYYPRYLTDEEATAALGMGAPEGDFTSHVPFGTWKMLRHGLRGVEEQVATRLGELEMDGEKAAFLRAALITLDAATEFIARHTAEALRLADETQNPERKAELKRIADSCMWLSTEPPRGFREAVQLFWLLCVVMAAENQSCIPIGRLDQDLYPFLESDLDAGRITLDEAQELVECLWIKLNFESDLTTDTCRNVTLAGQKADGTDATNTLTYICLDASHKLRLADPKINVRFHSGSPGRLLRKCVEMVKAGLGGFPAFYSDEAILEGLRRMGVPDEDARLYSCDGCQEIILPGKGDFYPVHTGVDLLACAQRTLGVEPYLVEIGGQPETPEAGDHGSFDDFMDAYMGNLDEMIAFAVKQGNMRDTGLAAYSPVPFLSSTLEGCVENAVDKTAGGCSYNWTGCNGQAFAAAVNSLAAVKKMVYDEGLITLAGLRQTLGDDWGDERLRQYALNRVPKWGNDDDYVDGIAVRVAHHFIEEVLKYSNPRGGPYYPGIFTFHHVSKGIRTSASPDGRHAGDPVAAHLSPVAGTDRVGPTSTLNSALKVYELRPPEGTALDIRFHPTAVMGDEGTAKLESFIRSFMDGGGTVVQFNVVDSETLRDAQENPEQYRSLLVRVWGFSAYFTTLTREYQDEIIARTVHGL
ncbi:hypothetical protein JXL21_06395 [Candidatus Bathyarchaeota archaeon]|nr:hypothetical protein [Candidatus Bathyarchaeota archaeon]